MTDLIPRDAALEALDSHAHGTTILGGQTYRSITLEVAVEALRAIPTIDPAAIREAAEALREECPWRDDTSSYREWHEYRRAIANNLLALIGEANSMIGEKK